MTPVSPFLTRSAIAVAAGAALATLAVSLAPGTYYDAVEWQALILPGRFGGLAGAVTPLRCVTDLLMAGFFFLIAKELWESLTIERGGLSGARALVPGCAALGGMAGGALVWLVLSALIETAEEAAGAPGWTVPLGSDVVLAYAFGRRLFGRGHPALQVLLFVTIADNLMALALSGAVVAGMAGLQPLWLFLPLAAALAGWALLSRPAAADTASERDRSRALALWRWAALAGLSWVGVAAAGLPSALGFLPILPALPPASRSYGLFAQAEGFMTDPANRAAQVLRPAAVVILFLFGLTHGALDLGAFAPTTWVALGALWVGKPVGLVLGLTVALNLLRLPLPRGVDRIDLWAVAGLCAIGFTVPAMVMAAALPGGAMQEAARLGLALSVLAGPVTLLLVRRIRAAAHSA
jgi:Na+:H+ antiporter, NhaA family